MKIVAEIKNVHSTTYFKRKAYEWIKIDGKKKNQSNMAPQSIPSSLVTSQHFQFSVLIF